MRDAVAQPFPWNAIPIEVKTAPQLAWIKERLLSGAQFCDDEILKYNGTHPDWIAVALERFKGRAAFLAESGPLLLTPSHDVLLNVLTDGTKETRCLIDDLSFSMLRHKRIYSHMIPGIRSLEYCPPARVADELEKLADQIRNSKEDQFIVAIGAAAHFVAIHPFRDGNGRASRRLLCKLLRHFGFWRCAELPLNFLIQHDRMHYVEAMRAVIVHSNWTPYFCYCVSLIAAAIELAVIQRQTSRTAAAARLVSPNGCSRP